MRLFGVGDQPTEADEPGRKVVPIWGVQVGHLRIRHGCV
jgi:hypothetical protein